MGIIIGNFFATIIIIVVSDSGITSHNSCYIKVAPCLSKLETIYVPITKGCIVIDSVRIIQAKIALPVKVETSKTEIDIIGKFRIDISAIPCEVPISCVYTN